MLSRRSSSPSCAPSRRWTLDASTSLADDAEDHFERPSFRCNHCIKVIDEDKPVFMRQDACYCSTVCRHKGRSNLYKHHKHFIADAHLDPYNWKRTNSGSEFSALSNLRSASASSMSESCASSGVSRNHAAGLQPSERQQGGLLGRIISRAVLAVATRVLGHETLQSASSLVHYGCSKIPQDSSFHQLLGYLPEIGYLPEMTTQPMILSPTPSEKSRFSPSSSFVGYDGAD